MLMVRRFLVVVAGVLVLGMLGAGPAFAGLTFPFDGQLAPSGGAFGNLEPGSVAVDDSNGNTYVADSAGGVVDVFETSSGAQLAGLDGALTPAGSFGGGQVEVAANNATGDVYVLDSTANVVDVFSPAGAYVCQITGGSTPSASECNAGGSDTPAHGLSTPGGIAVDQATGDVYVVDANNGVVDIFSAAGAYVRQISLASIPGFFAFYTRGIAVDDFNGDVYIADSGPEVVYVFNALGEWVTTWTGTPSGKFSGFVSVAADNTSGDVYVTESYNKATDVFDPTGKYLAQFGHSFNEPLGTSVGQASGRVYVSDQRAGVVDILGPGLVVPDVASGAASNVVTAPAAATATLNGTVNPSGLQVSDCHFEYGTGAAYGQSAPCTPAAAAIPADSSEHAVSAEVTGLTPGVLYHFRLSAANANGTVTGADQTFATGPVILSTSVANVTATSADLGAQVNPYLLDTTYHFQYGTSTGYGQSTPESASIGSDAEAHTATAHIQGLQPNTVYHYRVVATNSAAPAGADGPDHTFTTQPPASGFALPDGRGYELVTPADKGDGLLDLARGSGGGFQASASGSGVAYLALTPFPGAPAGVSVEYLAGRGAGGWSSQSLTPPQGTINNRVLSSPGVMAFSADLSKAAFVDGPPLHGLDFPSLVSGEPQNVQNLFVHDDTTGAYQLMDLTPSGVAPGNAKFEGASADFSRVFFTSDAQLTPDAAEHRENLFEWRGGSVSLAGQIPVAPATSCGGGGPACIASPHGASLGSASNPGEMNAVSLDGSKVFFTGAESANPGLSSRIYVREDGVRTVEVSASQKNNGGGPGGTDSAGPRIPTYWSASADGSKAFFTSCEQLTNDSTAHASQSTSPEICPRGNDLHQYPSGSDLYQYDTVSGALTDLAVDDSGDPLGADVQSVLGSSVDGSYVYFVANGVLASGASLGDCGGNGGGQCNLYVSHGGSTTFIASVNDAGQDGLGWREYAQVARVTPDGTHLAFEETRSLTGYDNTISNGSSSCGFRLSGGPTGDPHCREVYLYDAVSHQLHCASCNPSGARPLGGSNLVGIEQQSSAWGTEYGSFEYLPRTLSVDGSRVFFDSEDALVPGDVNARMDVYEYEAGRPYLISSGTSSDASQFVDASMSGNDVFFVTRSQLVGEDTDQKVDLYDARVGGGFPFGASPPECVGEACKPPPASGATGLSLGSSSSAGAGNLTLVPSPAVVVQRRGLSRAQKLAAAVRACRRKPRHQRASCVARAYRLFGPVRAARKSTKSVRGSK
jgi:DNA-binding beta-propeller fold protein YncE